MTNIIMLLPVIFGCTREHLFLIIQEWEINPLSVEDYKDETTAQAITIRAIEAKEADLSGKKKLSGKALIWFIVIGTVVAYLFFGGGLG